MLSEIILKEAIASLPESLRMIPLEESHVVCETVKENMDFMKSSGPSSCLLQGGSYSAGSLKP